MRQGYKEINERVINERTPMHNITARRKAVSKTKGRDLDENCFNDIRSLIGNDTPSRDSLIECLHRVQDHFGYVSADHLMALAHHMKLSQSEVYETATFYAHFNVLKDGALPPPKLIIRICNGPGCRMQGSKKLARKLATFLKHQAQVQEVPCVGQCDEAPAVHVSKNVLTHASLDLVETAVRKKSIGPSISDYQDLCTYVEAHGYQTFRSVHHGEISRENILKELETADLRGLGGAGFPVAKKWRFLKDQAHPRVLVVNADEGEPGTFKDRHLLETTPHEVLEGALIAAYTIEADDIYIYLRDEYPHLHALLTIEIDKLTQRLLTNGIRIHLRRGAGSYVCGEESAMLESLEGKRGMPRNRPPFPAQAGLFNRPTLVNNVETLFWVTEIVKNGGQAYQDVGRPHFYSVSGRVKFPGVYLAPAGTTARQLIDEYCGGMADGHELKGYMPGGASGGMLPERLADIPLDFGKLEEFGCFAGSSAVIVFSNHDDVHKLTHELMEFFAHESCGQCTPCRSGISKLQSLLATPHQHCDLIHEISQVMQDGSICGLGQAAANPVLTALRFFGQDMIDGTA